MAGEATAGPSEGQGTAASLNKEWRSLWAPEAQGAAEGWECGAEASRGPYGPRRPPMAPAFLATHTEAQLAAFRRRRLPDSATEGICKVPGSQTGIAAGKLLTLSRQQLADASFQIGGAIRAKVAKSEDSKR